MEEAKPVPPTSVQGTKGAALLVKKFFNATSQEIMVLPAPDRIQLGSAIARAEGLTQADCNFELVQY